MWKHNRCHAAMPVLILGEDQVHLDVEVGTGFLQMIIACSRLQISAVPTGILVTGSQFNTTGMDTVMSR